MSKWTSCLTASTSITTNCLTSHHSYSKRIDSVAIPTLTWWFLMTSSTSDILIDIILHRCFNRKTCNVRGHSITQTLTKYQRFFWTPGCSLSIHMYAYTDMVLSMEWFQVIDNWKHLAIYSLLWSLPNKLERYVTRKLTSLSYFYWEWLLELYCQSGWILSCLIILLPVFLAMLTYAHVLMLQMYLTEAFFSYPHNHHFKQAG